MSAALNELLAPILRRYSNVSAEAVDLVAEHTTLRELARTHALAEAGVVDGNEYFILQGVLHRTMMGQEGQPITSAFHVEGTVITPHFARTRQGRSLFTIEALTPSLVAAVPVAEFDRLRYSTPDMQAFGMRVVERELMESIHRSTAFRERSAADRLLALRNEFPGLENKVPHACIASFLGITTVSFSRLRGELARSI
ncbi:MAG: Crp/Fnr family transcriptional regulator [Flavobacteriales bacterium]|nr:Crp/Fnr family transcriptional regulator [Flavobacteriales bacterium]